jgi:hypothetical protein
MRLERSIDGPASEPFVTEVTVASFATGPGVQVRRYRNGGGVRVLPPVGPHGTFPSDGVAFRIVNSQGEAPPMIDSVPDSRFPIELATFRPSRLPHGVAYNATTGETTTGSDYNGVPPSVERAIQANDGRYAAIVWIGRNASPRLRAMLQRVVASLSFPRLHPGTMVGDLTVLQPARHYPVGSFTLIRAQGLLCNGDPRRCHWGEGAPFYLVHAPGRLRSPRMIEPCTPRGTCVPALGFYALGSRSEGTIGGYRSRCDLRLDRRRRQFYCTNLKARWDRVGQVIRRPPGARVDDPLQFSYSEVAWDGHVLLAAGTDEGPPRSGAAELLWPGWQSGR